MNQGPVPQTKANPDAGVDPADQREYDSFGPWILPVKTLDDMPPRFRAHYPEHAGAAYLLKMPRPEERRNLLPGMDLYPSVLAVHEDRVCLLVQAGERIEERRGACRNVQAVHVLQNLLRGRLDLLMDGGTAMQIDYNASSQPLVNRVVAFLAQRFPEPGRSVDLGAGRPGPVGNMAFQAALDEQARHLSRHQVLHYEAPGRPCRDRDGRRRLSLGVLVLGTARELVILTQGKPARKRREGVFANETVRIPWGNLRGVRREPAPSMSPATWDIVNLQMGSHSWALELFESGPFLDVLDRL